MDLKGKAERIKIEFVFVTYLYISIYKCKQYVIVMYVLFVQKICVLCMYIYICKLNTFQEKMVFKVYIRHINVKTMLNFKFIFAQIESLKK